MTTAERLSPTELATFADSYVAAWNSFDAGRMAPLVTDDIVWADPAMPRPAHGLAEVQAFMRDSWQAFPDLHFFEPDPRRIGIDGDTVLWAWRMPGTMQGRIDPPGFAPTNRRMTVDGVDVWEMRDGRIARYRAFYDMNDVARQLGIAPEPGSRAERGVA